MSDVVQRLWGFCHTLRHDGIDYGDYIEQITYLLFLKMADERGIDLHGLEVAGSDGKTVKVDCSWPRLRDYSGTTTTGGKAVIVPHSVQSMGPVVRVVAFDLGDVIRGE